MQANAGRNTTPHAMYTHQRTARASRQRVPPSTQHAEVGRSELKASHAYSEILPEVLQPDHSGERQDLRPVLLNSRI